MSVRLIDPVSPEAATQPPARPASVPDPGYEALPHLKLLRDRVLAAVESQTPSRWKEPPLFFFDKRRQAEYDAVRALEPVYPFAEVSTAIASTLPELFASVDVRRVARDRGLACRRGSARPKCPVAKDLADLLTMPDDEVIVVLHPDRRAGFRLAIRGVADVGQFHILLSDAVKRDFNLSVPQRFVEASRDVYPATPGGVPMVVAAQFQMYAPAALERDGSLPSGMAGCKHWLWPATPLASIPRESGERIVLIGPPAFAATREVSRRFPAMPAEARLIESLSPFRVAERLSCLTGEPVSPSLPRQMEPALAKAA